MSPHSNAAAWAFEHLETAALLAFAPARLPRMGTGFRMQMANRVDLRLPLHQRVIRQMRGHHPQRAEFRLHHGFLTC
jgi:hypothetical protein